MTISFRMGLGGASTVDLGDVVFTGEVPGLVESADGESPGMSGVEVQDPDGSLEIKGLNKFEVEESACSNVRCFTGIIQEHPISRGTYTAGAGRVHDTNVVDANGYLKLRVIRDGNHGNRPAETDVERVAWLLDEVLRAGHVINGTGGTYGANGPTAGVLGAPRNLDATDYRGQHATDVLADIGPPGNRRYFCYWDPDLEAVCLFYGLNSEHLADSTLRISNVEGDHDSVTFPPFQPATQLIDPIDVFGGVLYTYRNGSARLYREDPDTISEFLDRSVAITNDRVGSDATASTFVDRLLEKAGDERISVTVTIKVPKEQVNLVVPGMRMSVKFSHFEGLAGFTWMHVLKRTVIQEFPSVDVYYLTLELCDYIGGVGTGGGGGGGPFVPGPITEPQTPGEASLYMALDNGFYPAVDGSIVYVNGTPITIGSGGDPANRDDRWEVPVGVLTSGENVIAVGIENGNSPASWWGGNKTGLLLRLHIGADDSTDAVVWTDTTTKIWAVENLAGTLGGEPANWETVAFDDSGWDNAAVVGDEPSSGGPSTTYDAGFPPTAPAQWVGPAEAVGITTANEYPQSLVWLARIHFNTDEVVENTPTHGQQVTESTDGDGVTTDFQTNYPYLPNSLVVHVGGVAVVPTQTDPTTGEFTLPFAPPVGTDNIVITYQAANGTDTGAGNNPTPPSTTPTIPGEVLGGHVHDPADATQVWMPLTTVVGGDPELVWDGDDSLVPTLTPLS